MLSGYRRLRLRVVVNTVVLFNLRRDRISTEPGPNRDKDPSMFYVPGSIPTYIRNNHSKNCEESRTHSRPAQSTQSTLPRKNPSI